MVVVAIVLVPVPVMGIAMIIHRSRGNIDRPGNYHGSRSAHRECGSANGWRYIDRRRRSVNR